ncbi:hypothetical protein CALCODRAFT_89101 [Calocera cornea HHB12733]|uniref:Uncharacterized protein n=1 Tax=Calocera cornea HHB12733 TaxID=1353952 RepID=A0A165DBU9_9BASI|nr:hypothetical protein CALCODRAFT_89101 [Calocera cornea HHB12733]
MRGNQHAVFAFQRLERLRNGVPTQARPFRRRHARVKDTRAQDASRRALHPFLLTLLRTTTLRARLPFTHTKCYSKCLPKSPLISRTRTATPSLRSTLPSPRTRARARPSSPLTMTWMMKRKKKRRRRRMRTTSWSRRNLSTPRRSSPSLAAARRWTTPPRRRSRRPALRPSPRLPLTRRTSTWATRRRTSERARPRGARLWRDVSVTHICAICICMRRRRPSCLS